MSDVCVLVLIFNATQHCSTLPTLFPSHVFRHYSYLNDALPDIVPQLNVSVHYHDNSVMVCYY